MKCSVIFCFCFFNLLIQPTNFLLASANPPDFSEVNSKKEEQEIIYSDKIFYSSTRSLQKKDRVTDNVTIITREEIDKWPVSDLEDVLGMINGVVIQKAAGIGQTAVAQIGASNAREVRVMVDGITFNAVTSLGIADLSQIPLDIVEKIEVIKGASSSVWGSSMGGVINIITRAPGKEWIPKGRVTSTFGERGTKRERGELAGRLGSLRYYGMGSHTVSDGFRPYSDVYENRSFGKLELPLNEAIQLSGSFGHSYSDIGEFEYPAAVPSRRADRKTLSRYGSAGVTIESAENIHSELFYKLSERSARRTTGFFLPNPTFFRWAKAQSIIHEVSYETVWDITEHQTLVAGSDVGVEVYRDASFQGATTRANINKENTRHAYYLNYQHSFESFDVTAGGRLDATNGYGVNFNPSLGAAYHLPFWNGRLRANVARAFNAPSLSDRYLTVGTTVANPDLEAERAIVYNLGPEFEPIHKVHTKVVFFQSFIDDSIQSIIRSDQLSQAVNLKKERRTGFETELKVGPWFGTHFSYETAYTRAVDPGGGGIPLQSRPRFTQDLKLNYTKDFYGFRFNSHVAGRWMDLVNYGSNGFLNPQDQVMIFNSKLQLTLPEIIYGNLSLFLLGNNLFNDKFAFDSQTPDPGRNFEFGIQYNF